LLILLFFAPFLADRFYQAIRHDRFVLRAQPAWFQDDNPFGLSREFLVWLRELPRGQTFLVAPDGLDCLHAYAPHYETILPVTTLLIDMEERRQIETGEHPILMKCYSPGHPRYARYSSYSVSHERALTWLDKQGVGYLLLDRAYYDNYLRDYVAANPRYFEVVFHNPRNRELVVRYIPRP
jgi:hypothetical protein